MSLTSTGAALTASHQRSKEMANVRIKVVMPFLFVEVQTWKAATHAICMNSVAAMMGFLRLKDQMEK